MSPKIVDKQKRKREILAAAFELFVEKGYHKTTLGDIARAAGMGQGTLYYYFPAKEQIFWGVYEQLMSDIEAVMLEQITIFQSPQEQLDIMLKLLFQNFPEAGIFDPNRKDALDNDEGLKGMLVGFSRVLMEFWLQAERSGKRDEFYQRIARQQRAMIGRMQELLERVGVAGLLNLDAGSLAHLIMALRDGISFQLRMGIIDKDSEVLTHIRQALFKEFHEDDAKTKTS